MNNVVLTPDMAYVEDDHLVLVIPIPKQGFGWVPDKSDMVERVTVIDAVNGTRAFRGIEEGTRQDIKGLDDPTAVVEVKLKCDPLYARDKLGQEIVLREQRTSTPKKERNGIPVNSLTTKATAKVKASPVVSRKK